MTRRLIHCLGSLGCGLCLIACAQPAPQRPPEEADPAIVTTTNPCEPSNALADVWEDGYTVTLHGSVKSRQPNLQRTVEVFEDSGFAERKRIGAVAAGASDGSFQLSIPVERHGPLWCSEGLQKFYLKADSRRLIVESLGCKAARVVCGDDCEPQEVSIECP